MYVLWYYWTLRGIISWNDDRCRELILLLPFLIRSDDNFSFKPLFWVQHCRVHSNIIGRHLLFIDVHKNNNKNFLSVAYTHLYHPHIQFKSKYKFFFSFATMMVLMFSKRLKILYGMYGRKQSSSYSCMIVMYINGYTIYQNLSLWDSFFYNLS